MTQRETCRKEFKTRNGFLTYKCTRPANHKGMHCVSRYSIKRLGYLIVIEAVTEVSGRLVTYVPIKY